MTNILFKFKSRRFLYFFNTERSSTFRKCFSRFLLGRRTLNSENCLGETNPIQTDVRHICSSVNKSDISSDLLSGEKKRSQYSIVYNGAISYQVKGVKAFTCITSLGGILIQPLLVQNILNGTNTPLGVAVFCCVGFFTFLTPFFIHLITKKYVTEIWYNSTTDTYTATVLSFFLKKIHITFKVEDVTIPSMLPIFSTMNIKGRPVFIIREGFLEINHYIKMMGYDKPMNMESHGVDNSFKVSENKAKSEM